MERVGKGWPAELASDLFYRRSQKPLFEYLRDYAGITPEKTAIVWYGRELSYREINDLSDRFASYLRNSGLKKGERVALFLSNCPQYFIAHYGIQKCGGVVCPCSPLFKEWELEYQLKDSEAKIIVTADKLYDIVLNVLPQTSLEQIILTSYGDLLPLEPTINVPEDLCQPKPSFADSIDLLTVINRTEATGQIDDVNVDDLALLVYTSGTTGKPKGAMLTHRNALFKSAAVVQSNQIGTAETILSVAPLYHIAGMLMGLNCAIYANATTVLLYRFDPLAVLQAIERYKCTWWYSMVPMNIHVMQVPNAGLYDLTSLKINPCTSFGINLTQELAEGWAKFTGGCKLFEGAYGLSESHTGDTFMPVNAIKYGTQGIPTYETSLRILDPQTGEEKPTGEMGEIVLKNPGVFKGYWNRVEETAQTLRNGWVHTGDIGFLDEEGYLTFSGRLKEMIKVSGYSVFPEEVEAMLIRHEAIAQVAVIGIKDSHKGEVVKAFVVLKSEHKAHLTPQTIIDWARLRMSPYKSPRFVEFRDTLPSTGAGKVLRRLLQEQ
ncbi:acyl-CoA synthetase (AMP-forming)/AMP-acid ligase II [Desulfosporosinus acidiphilus SJ4]|uniref:Acyl-CoA synthetase (AMP-forming)/AMP-acid ligase II n=1 Tax=Desulfosporosinus acidiphilus (strain DSM 22704 / JCM 16185 / SJ4) TaxID=646529 RepID=I4D2T2_DESAJ|nr:AMP-binding protein [Desulfosporosinus acidiphilus]AFM40106.1 acyl-CoA synthetase (AMP-forming)/AMP-acid ligase II [Desulfosporosinus acidiphilus SJ4]